MGDRFDEAANKIIVSHRWECLISTGDLATALREYEEKYLAEALTAATIMREKGTCEWQINRREGGNSWEGACGIVTFNPPYNYCPYCGRRIEEAK
jgi:hypothetical protein